MKEIIRFGVSIQSHLLKKFDRTIRKKGYTNRSKAIRDLIRKNIIYENTEKPSSVIIATLTIIYDHHIRNLTNKLLDIQHAHHDEILTTTHIHINPAICLEVLVLRGKAGRIKKLADNIKAVKGVINGELTITKSSI